MKKIFEALLKEFPAEKDLSPNNRIRELVGMEATIKIRKMLEEGMSHLKSVINECDISSAVAIDDKIEEMNYWLEVLKNWVVNGEFDDLEYLVSDYPDPVLPPVCEMMPEKEDGVV